MPGTALHPVLRYSQILIGGVLAIASVIVSFRVNPHSTAWLLGVYTTLALLIVAWRSGRSSPLHRSYALYLLALNQYLLNVWFLHVWMPGSDVAVTAKEVDFGSRIIGTGAIFLPVALYHFTLRFAETRSRVLFVLEWLGWLAGAFFLIANAGGNLFTGFIWTRHTWAPEFKGLYAPFSIFVSIYLVLGLLVPLVRVFTHLRRQRRLQLFYFVIGAIPLFVSCWVNFLLSQGADVYPAGGIMFLLHAAIVAYAVLKHGVYDITLTFRRALAYAGVSLSLGMIYGGVIWSLPQGNVTAAGFAFVIAAGLLAAPLLHYFQRAIDRFFYRDDTHLQDALELFARESASSVQLNEVATSLCVLLQCTFRPRMISLYLNDSAGQPILYGSAESAFQPAHWPEGECLAENMRVAIASRVASPVRVPDAAGPARGLALTDGDEGLAVAIVHGSTRLGCLVLGAKRAGEPYDDTDIRRAETIAAHSSVALLNARSFAQLQHLQELTTQTLDGLSAAVMVLTGSGRVLRWNPALDRLVQSAENKSAPSLDRLDPLLAAAIRAALQDGATHNNEELRLEGKTPLCLLFSMRTLGKIEGESAYLVLLHDISNYKNVELAARRREGLARMGEVIAAINHELKNILQPIQYQVSRLEQIESGDVAFRRAMSVIPDRLKALDRMLANLRDLARPIELRMRQIDLESLINAVWLDIHDAAVADEIEFKLEIANGAGHCDADGSWLRQIIYNVLKNAVDATFGRAQRCINVSVELDGAAVLIRVSDNGCGVDEPSMARLFEPFFSTKGEAGTGLGLSICRKLVDLHGGRIDASSKAGKGTVFSIRLPLHQASVICAPAPQVQASALSVSPQGP